MTTKMEESIADAKKTVTNAAGALRDNIDAQAPHWLVNLLRNIIEDDRTPWFFLGMALEAIGISVQFWLGQAAYPILDCVVGGAIGIGLMYWQGRQEESE